MTLLPAASSGISSVSATALQGLAGDANLISLCSLNAGDDLFGIDTRTIKEVLGNRALRKVPLAPAYIGGIVPYRGEVLTTVSFRALLGLPPFAGESCVIVLEDEESGDHFGLMVDGVGGVIVVDRRTYSPNPSTVDPRSALLYDGVFRASHGLLILLTSRKLRPARLQDELFLPSPGSIKYLPGEETARGSAGQTGWSGGWPKPSDGRENTLVRRIG